MSWTVIAKKDFRDAVQSRALWGLVAVFVVLSSVLSYVYAEFPAEFAGPGGEAPTPTIGGLVFFTSGAVSLFVAIAAIVVCYKSVAGERELGSIKLLLSLPHTRRAVFVGKIVGRSAVLAVGLFVGLFVGFGLGAVLLGEFAVVPVAVFLALTLLVCVVYAGIMVSLSATTGSTSRATTLAVGFFVVVELLWDAISVGILYVGNGFTLSGPPPDWFFLVSQVPPSAAYSTALVAVLPDLADSVGGGVGSGQFDAFYAVPELGLLYLLLWLVLPATIGYRRFDAADL